MKNRSLGLYRLASLAMAVVFAAVGLIFLFQAGLVLEFFNRLSAPLGMPPSPLQPGSFYPLLAVAYMYLVTLLAWMMFRRPKDPHLPLLLAQAKFASSLLSIFFFFGRAPYLVCLANAVVDGGIGALVLWLVFLQKRYSASWPN